MPNKSPFLRGKMTGVGDGIACSEHVHPASVRQERSEDRRDEHTSSRKVKLAVRANISRDQGSDDRRQPSPEARETCGGPTHGRRECLGRPAIQDGVEGRLEEVLHGVEADGAVEARDGNVEEERGGHHGGSEDHRPFTTDAGDLDEDGTESNAGHTSDGDEDAGKQGH
jgi:hypothetical protein